MELTHPTVEAGGLSREACFMTKVNKKQNKAIRNFHDAVRRLTSCKMEIAERFDVKKIGLFGSFVRGEQKRGSDVDILVEYSELPNLLEFVRLERYLEGILKKKVDLVEKSSLRDELKKPIGKEIVFI